MADQGGDWRVRIRCVACGNVLAPLAHTCPRCPGALPRSEYAERRFLVGPDRGIFRFSTWLPAEGTQDTAIGPLVLRSERLAAALGLADLSVAFSGWVPERGAHNPTGTFKDFEALPTLLYLRERGAEGVVLASAGSTARAFAHAAGVLGFPAVIVVPESAAPAVWVPGEPSNGVRLVVIRNSVDYAGAIRLAAAISDRYGLPAEGGARNVARRDGMGTVILEYARTERKLPLHYVQAVGSGTGGIAAWEAAARLLASGGFGASLPRLHLAQNAPFTPLHDAWSAGAPIEPERDVEGQMGRIAQLAAPVLANRTPPFAVAGGVRDALAATHGLTYAVTNTEIAAAQRLFQQTEGLPVGPESGAALSALRQAIAAGEIRRNDPVLLHATGSTGSAAQSDPAPHLVPVWQSVPADEAAALRALDRAFAR